MGRKRLFLNVPDQEEYDRAIEIEAFVAEVKRVMIPNQHLLASDGLQVPDIDISSTQPPKTIQVVVPITKHASLNKLGMVEFTMCHRKGKFVKYIARDSAGIDVVITFKRENGKLIHV